MEPPGGRRPGMSGNGNATVASSSSVVGLLLSPARSPAAAISSGANKSAGLHQCHGGDGGHRGVQPSQQQQQHLVQQHHQYPAALGPPPLIRSSLVHSAGSLLSAASPQLMLSATAPTSTAEAIPRYQPHGGGGGGSSHQLGAATTPPAPSAAAAAAAVGPSVMAGSNISTLGMVSPFGILPHERVVPLHQTPHHHHRHLNRKLPACQQQQQQQQPSSKTLMETGGAQLLATSVANPQRFYDEPLGNKMKDFDGVQQSPHHRLKMANGIAADKGQPVAVSGGYSPQPYESRYQPRTAAQQVGYLSVITRTAVTTANSAVMDDVTSNNYYQAQASALHAKTPDHHDRQYYHFDSTISASQTPQQQVDNMLLMGNPVQRGDPMHIVKNLQSMQTDMDCYGVKKMIEQQPRLLSMDNSKSVGPTALLNNSKCSIESQHQNIHQLSKSTVTDPSLSYNSQYFNRRQPPPAHLHQHHNQSHIQQHLASGNSKMLPTPTSLTVVAANGSNYFDQRHHRWNLDQQKPPTISTPSCFSGNIPTGMFHQPSLPPQQQYNNTVSTFNVQPPAPGIHQHQHMSESTHHNNFIVSSGSPTYYNLTTTMVSPTVTSVTTTSPPIAYNRHHNNQQYPNNFHNFANNVHGENFAMNDDNRVLSLPHVVVPSIEQELDHLCEDPVSTASVIVKPSNVVTKKPSFIDSYIKFLNGDTSTAVVETEDECFEKPKKLQRPTIASPPKLISKPYIPLSKPKVPVSISETPSSRNGSCESVKNIVTTTDDDPRYFPLPKTSASSTVLSDGSNSDNNWLSADDDHDQWWTSPSKTPSIPAASAIKNKLEVNKKKKNSSAVKKKQSNSVTTTKKRKTQNEKQPRRQSSHRLAKEKTQKLLTNLKSDEDVESDTDSDVDPAWIPNNDDNDVSKSSSSIPNRRHFSHKKFSKEQCSNSDHSPSTSSLINNNNQTDDSSITMPFKSGSFVALKSQFAEKGCKRPQLLWRVDGKSLLQKFQRVSKNTFRSVTTYTGWGPSHYSMYRQVAIEFITPQIETNNVQNKVLNTEILIKLITDDDDDDDDNNSDDDGSSADPDCSSKQKVGPFSSKSSDFVNDPSMKKLRAHFDVYVQTLTSHALDSSFIDEIYRENDDYFLSNMHAIEVVTQSCIKTMESIITHDSIIDFSKIENVCTLATRYPDMEILTLDEIAVRNIQLLCIACGRRGFVGRQQPKFVEISFSGSRYHPKLLTEVDVNEAVSKTNPTKKAHCCSNTKCTDKLEILHSLKHLKYRIYKECCKRITTENNSCYESAQETTSVLNRILADEQWIFKLFQTVSKTWSRAKMFISNKQ